MKYLTPVFLIVCFFACKEDEPQEEILNTSDRFAECNRMLPDCNRGDGDYCLFGYKWGPESLFFPAGVEVSGPGEPGGTVTFSFQEEYGVVNTHSQVNLPGKSFSSLISCAKTEIRNALISWAEAANIEFSELPENSTSDIRFFVADIRQSGIGYPNYPDALCDRIGGDVIIQTTLDLKDCHSLYLFALHEIGHTLGLGHVNTSNIMNPEFLEMDFDGLQEGDRRGIVEIYGTR